METNARIYGYARVSTVEQNLDRQIESLKGAGLRETDIFCDSCSGKDFNRPEYQKLKTYLQQGDTLMVTEVDRLARNYQETLNELQYFKSKGIKVRILGLDFLLNPLNQEDSEKYKAFTSNPLLEDFLFDIIIRIYALSAEKERQDNERRRREGMENRERLRKEALKQIEAGEKTLQEVMKDNPTLLYKGKPKQCLSNKWEDLYYRWVRGKVYPSLYKSEKITTVEFMKQMNMAKTTFHSAINDYEGIKHGTEPRFEVGTYREMNVQNHPNFDKDDIIKQYLNKKLDELRQVKAQFSELKDDYIDDNFYF